MKKCAKYDFLINSEEFLLFSRPVGGDIEKSFLKFTKIPTPLLIERIRTATNVNEKSYDLSEKQRIRERLIDF
jgi:hypothetical protein